MTASRSEFGITLLRLANEQKWISSEKELIKVLNEAGYEYKQSTVNAYLRGQRKAPPQFMQAVVETLELDEQQELTLMRAWTYGQDRFPTLI